MCLCNAYNCSNSKSRGGHLVFRVFNVENGLREARFYTFYEDA